MKRYFDGFLVLSREVVPFLESGSEKGIQNEEVMPFSEGKREKGHQNGKVMPFLKGEREKGHQLVFHNLPRSLFTGFWS